MKTILSTLAVLLLSTFSFTSVIAHAEAAQTGAAKKMSIQPATKTGRQNIQSTKINDDGTAAETTYTCNAWTTCSDGETISCSAWGTGSCSSTAVDGSYVYCIAYGADGSSSWAQRTCN